MNIFPVIFKSISIIAAIYVSAVVIKRNRRNMGNLLFGVAFVLLGLYAVCNLIFEFPISIPLSSFLINSSLFFLTLGALLWVMSIQTLIQGEEYIKSPINIIHCLLAVILMIIFIIFPYKIRSIDPEVDLVKPLFTLVAVAIFTIYIMTYNLILINAAIKKIDKKDADIRKKFSIVFVAQIFGILIPLVSVVGTVVKNDIIYSTLFVFLGLSLVTLGMALRR